MWNDELFNMETEMTRQGGKMEWNYQLYSPNMLLNGLCKNLSRQEDSNNSVQSECLCVSFPSFVNYVTLPYLPNVSVRSVILAVKLHRGNIGYLCTPCNFS